MSYHDLRVLIVDHEHVRRASLAQRITAYGTHRIHETNSATEALSLFQDGHHFDLIITDLQLPDSDGLALIQTIARDTFRAFMVLLADVDSDIFNALQCLPEKINACAVRTVAHPVSDATVCDVLACSHQLRLDSGKVLHRPSLTEISEGLAQGQFVAFLEPQVVLESNAVSGFEALVRWQHPRRGWITPDHFIAAAEDSYLIGPLTLAVLDSALESLAALRLAGFSGGISVNLSARSLADPQFPALLASHVRRAGLRYSDVMLEITETARVSDSIAEISGLARLRLAGFKLALDDFGMGFSSLAKLSQGAFGEVKIDRQFTSRVNDDPTCRAAIESTLALAHALKWICVAEGMETESTKQALMKLGCSIGHGYLFSRPLPPDTVVNWWRDWEQSRLRNLSNASQSGKHALADHPRPVMGDDRQLSNLAARAHPVWIFDLNRYEMVWANAAALTFWEAEDLKSLRERDFNSDLTPATRQRLDNTREALRNGRPINEQWTLYPNGHPKVARCTLTGLFGTSGRASMVVEAQPVDIVETEGHLESEAVRALGVPTFVVSPRGAIEWRNAFASACFGVRKTDLQSHFVDTRQATQLIEEAMRNGEAHCDALLDSGCGTILHRINFRRMRDRSNGRELVAGIMVPIGDTLHQTTCQLLCNKPCPRSDRLAAIEAPKPLGSL